MNYRHIYHAGNVADVFKHFILTLLLEKLLEKDTPFCVLDTHAGIGLYDLSTDESRKTGEAEAGIHRLMKAEDAPPAFGPYLESVAPLYAAGLYPGSAMLIQHALRATDRLVACELHPADFLTLRNVFVRDVNVKTLNLDGYLALKSVLPPPEKRGLVFIDPPFEKRDEIETLVRGLTHAHRRFAHGMYAIWFPIKTLQDRDLIHHALMELPFPKMLGIDLWDASATNTGKLAGSGMVLINPPWTLEETLKPSLPWLQSALGLNHSALTWLRQS